MIKKIQLLIPAAMLAALSITTAQATPSLTPASSWSVEGGANSEGDVNTVLVSGDTLYVGGDFQKVVKPDERGGGFLYRDHLVAINLESGKVGNPRTIFAPDLNGEVFALAASNDGETLYVGGNFTRAEGQPRARIAAFNARTGELKPFNASLNVSPRSIVVAQGAVYVGGLFTRANGEVRNHLAAFDAETGDLDPVFRPNVNDAIKSIKFGADRLWIGGNFTRVTGEPQNYFGAVDPVTGGHKPTMGATAPVIALDLGNAKVFAAIGGPGGRAAAYNRVTGNKEWQIKSEGNFQAVSVRGFAYFGGHYEKVENFPGAGTLNPDADRLTRHDKATGEMDLSWFPQVNGIRSINAIDTDSDGVYIGGDFTKVGGKDRQGFAILLGSPTN